MFCDRVQSAREQWREKMKRQIDCWSFFFLYPSSTKIYLLCDSIFQFILRAFFHWPIANVWRVNMLFANFDFSSFLLFFFFVVSECVCVLHLIVCKGRTFFSIDRKLIMCWKVNEKFQPRYRLHYTRCFKRPNKRTQTWNQKNKNNNEITLNMISIRFHLAAATRILLMKRLLWKNITETHLVPTAMRILG